MTSRSALGVALVGSALLAVTYGLARFVFGLFLPAMRDELGIGTEFAGLIAAIPSASFAVAIAIAPCIAWTLGVRVTAALASILAVAGLLAIAGALRVDRLMLGLAICGLSTGLSSPMLAHAVHLAVRHELRDRVNATVNAGTSVGIAISMPALILWADAWRSAYEAFAWTAVLIGGLAVVYLPSRGPLRAIGRSSLARPSITRQQWFDVLRLSALAGATGFTSAVYWVFAPDWVVEAGGLDVEDVAWMWLVVGVGGLLGVGAGDLIARHGAAMSHAFALSVLAASLAILAASPQNLVLVLGSAGAFGAAYMTLTGFHLVRSTQLMIDHPAVGPIMPLIAIALGQIAGAPLAGRIIAVSDHATAFGSFAGCGVALAILSVMFAASDRQTILDRPDV